MTALDYDREAAAELLARLDQVAPHQRLDTLAMVVAAYVRMVQAGPEVRR